MKIHEYQGKELLKQFGIPVPRGIPALSVDEAVAAAEKLGGPVWVVKAQIHAAGLGNPGHAADHAPDWPGRPEGSSPVHRRRRRHPEGILRVAGH
ncbi:hypothetical protein G6F68_021280 [Rhizopus microsporus]|nr:hypothetical protein G6F68_021280 [Rhizopus microsporus]